MQDSTRLSLELIQLDGIKGNGLTAAYYDSGERNDLLLLIQGVNTSIVTSRLARILAETLIKSGISVICAHLKDSFSYISTDSNGKRAMEGSATDTHSTTASEIDAFLSHAGSLGYRRIHLAGHSLGANKVVAYLANKQSDSLRIHSYIVLSPVDPHNVVNHRDTASLKEQALMLVANGQGHFFLPQPLCGFIPITAQALLRHLESPYLWSCETGETLHRYPISVPGIIIIGEHDFFSSGNPSLFERQLSYRLSGSKAVDFKIIDNAGHVFYGVERILGQEIARFIVMLST